jgi:hypothetical protein
VPFLSILRPAVGTPSNGVVPMDEPVVSVKKKGIEKDDDGSDADKKDSRFRQEMEERPNQRNKKRRNDVAFKARMAKTQTQTMVGTSKRHKKMKRAPMAKFTKVLTQVEQKGRSSSSDSDDNDEEVTSALLAKKEAILAQLEPFLFPAIMDCSLDHSALAAKEKGGATTTLLHSKSNDAAIVFRHRRRTSLEVAQHHHYYHHPTTTTTTTMTAVHAAPEATAAWDIIHRRQCHWDFLLQEMQWLATDYAQERKV